MTTEELKQIFGIEDGIFYRVNKNKSQIEMLTDADQSISTYADQSGSYIRVMTEFTHSDYTKVE